MKTLFLAIATFAVSNLSSSAGVLTANNNNPSPGQYTTLAAAQAAASTGDTIYVSGSPNNYNSITIQKSLVWIGTGHKPQNDNPSTSYLDNISFDNNNIPNGSVFIGLDLSDIYLGNRSGIKVLRCKIRNIAYLSSGASNSCTFESCWFSSTGWNLYDNAGYQHDNYTVANNVFSGQCYLTNPSNNINFYFRNNLFLVNNDAFGGSMKYIIFQNNIFYRANPVSAAVTNCVYENNISYQATNNAFAGGIANTFINNLPNTDPLFVSFPSAGADYSYAYDFNLQTSSPADNAGTDGKDIGLTGGNGYFQKYGIPSIPQVRVFEITSPSNAAIAPGGTLQINVRSTIKR